MHFLEVILTFLVTSHCTAKQWERLEQRLQVGFLDARVFSLDYLTGFYGLPKEFEAKKLNWAVTDWMLLHGRNYLTDILFPFSHEENVIIIPYPKQEPNTWAAFLPYTGQVWACVLSAMAITSLSLVWLARKRGFIFSSTLADPFVSFHGSAMYVVGVATNQGASCFSKARSTRLVAGVWCLAALVLVNAYSSCLMTYLTIPIISPLVRKIEDITNRSEPQIWTATDTFIRVLFENSNRYRPYYANAMKLPNQFCGSTLELMEKCTDLVKKGGYVMTVDGGLAALLLHQDYSNTGSCQLSLAEAKFQPGYMVTVMPLNSPHELRNRVDVLTLEAVSYGLVDEWKRRFKPKINPCVNFKSTSAKAKSFTLKDFSSAFVILGIGTTCSFILFLCELVTFRISNRKSRGIT